MWFRRNKPQPKQRVQGEDVSFLDLPEPTRALIAHVERMGRDAAEIATTLRLDQHLPHWTQSPRIGGPVRCAGIENLFLSIGANGSPVYTLYHYTEDFRTITPSAQYDLSQLMGTALQVNKLINALRGDRCPALKYPILSDRLDTIIARASFFSCLFRNHSISTDIYVGRLKRPDLDNRLALLSQGHRVRMRAAQQQMTSPRSFGQRLPRPSPPFLIGVARKYEPGQKNMNGVYFPKDIAQKLIADAARQQGTSVASAAGHRRAVR